MSKSSARVRTDVLILHGKSLAVVEYLKELLTSLEREPATVLDLPSRGLAQEARVRHYIKECSLPIVVVTFDEDAPDGNSARPNLYDELARCRELRPKDTLVLRERRGSARVALPSNVEGTLVIVEFEATALHRVVPALIRELRSRGIVPLRRPAEDTMHAGRLFNEFLDAMDELWDNEFDRAWSAIFRVDHDAERAFAIILDKFFQEYQEAFSALIRQRKRGDALSATCDRCLDRSRDHAAAAWGHVAEAKLKRVEERAEHSAAKGVPGRHVTLHREAAHALNKANSAADNRKKIELLRESVALSEKILKEHR